MAATKLRVELLGGFRLLAGGRADARLPGARQQELIALLILQARGTPIPRQRCAAVLWPDSTDAQALTNLRRELHHLREDRPDLEALIDVESRTLAWRVPGAIADVHDFNVAVERGLAGDRVALQDAGRLYKGDLLPDCLAAWIEDERERLRLSARKTLARLVAHLEQEGSYDDAIEHAQTLCRLDPLDEDAWCALMRCHAGRGARAAALHAYQECAAHLKKDLGVAPGARTRATYREILALGDAEPAAESNPPRTSVYPLIGRAREWQTLLAAWQAAERGHPRLALIRGESGIGKTRLAEELGDWSRSKGQAVIASRCYAGEGRLAYAPIASWLKSDAMQPVLRKLNAVTLVDVARLWPGAASAVSGVRVSDQQLESWQHLRFFESLATACRAAAPVTFVLDDLHWADPDTIDWLEYFLRSIGPIRCLVVATVRAEEEQDNPPIGRLVAHLRRDDRLTLIEVGRLDPASTAELAGAVSERALDADAGARVFRETEGHPLFIIERARMDAGKTPRLADDAASSRVQSLVAARLALLSEDARAVAALAAAIGRDFRFDLLMEAGNLEEDALVRALDELWRRHIVRAQEDERWDFSHDRIREVAYDGIGPAGARLIHRRIAQAMERLCAGRLDDVSAAIAVHLERGGQPARAIPFLERAAEVATRVTANGEAIRCLTQALALIERLPPGRDRDVQELKLRSILSVALNATRGYAAPEVEANLDRVFALIAQTGGEMSARWLWAAFSLRYVLGDVTRALAVAEQALAQSEVEPASRCEAHHAMAATLLSAGRLEPSRLHFKAALAAYNEQRPRRSVLGSDLGVFARAWYSHALWLLGDEEAAIAESEESRALAERIDHPYSQALALAYAALLHQMRREPDGVLERANAAARLCEKHGFAYYGDWAKILLGWTRGQRDPAEGVALIESALQRLDGRRELARRPYYMSLLAETQILAGNTTGAAAILNDAINISLGRSEVWWLPALLLQKADVGPPTERADTVRRGLELAREQDSRALEGRLLAGE